MRPEYEVLVVGGGIVGAGIFRDLSLHNVKTLLVERDDFSSQTSRASSKMLHGGIRYLETMDFSLVYEALHEKNLWLNLAPNLCYESPFILPVYKNSLRPLWMIRCGLLLYDLLSGLKNSFHKILGPKETLNFLPDLETKNLVGSGLYYDAIVDDEELCKKVIEDALKNSSFAHAESFIEFKNFEILEDESYKVFLYDRKKSVEKIIHCREIIFAVGPFTDKILSQFPSLHWSPILLPSKGSHIWLSKTSLNIETPMVLTMKDGRIIFVIPQKKGILVGTTEVIPETINFDVKISPEEVLYLLEAIHEFFPNSQVTEKDILSSFAGIRPLIKGDDNNRGKTAREHKIYRPLAGLYVIAGGKYTTFRKMGQEISREICLKLNKNYNSQKSMSPLS